MSARDRRNLGGTTPTPHEVAVLQAVADGHTGPEIVARLGVTPDSVKTSLQRVRARLQARDSAHAVAIALRAGIIH